jgi:hypothetical protein
MSVHDCDVVIAGAGLVGLSLAGALAESGLAVALADRAPVAVPPDPADDADWDARVYAISPGSATFLRSVGAWQAAADDHRRQVDAVAAAAPCSASRVRSRRACACLDRRERALGVVNAPSSGVALFAPRAFDSVAWSPGRALLRFGDGASVGPARRRRRAPLGRAAAGVVAAVSYGQTAVVFACEPPPRMCRGGSRRGSVLASRCRGGACRSSGRRPTRLRPSSSQRRGSSRRGSRPATTRWANSPASPRRPASAALPQAANSRRPPLGVARRRGARHPSTTGQG